MMATRFRTESVFHFCVLSGLVWPLTTSFETFEPSECTEHFEALTQFGNSYLDCVDSCKNVVECTGISYLRRQLMCRNHFTFGVLKKCPGYVLSMKTEWRHRDGQCVCPATNDCDQSGECVLSGCTKLQEPARGKVYGKMLGIGAKVIIKCNPGYVLNQPGPLVCKVDGQWSGETPDCIEDPECTHSLVDKVGDDKLSQSSSWCDTTSDCTFLGVPDGMTAKYGRLTSKGFLTGSWSAATGGGHEYIQVDFVEQRVISAVMLTGREHIPLLPRNQLGGYVTEFRLLISSDCITFDAIKDDSGGDKVFVGNSELAEIVTRPLAERVTARCVRINPTKFELHMSMRFDVLGC